MLDKISNESVSFKQSIQKEPDKKDPEKNIATSQDKAKEIAKLTAAVFAVTLVAVGGVKLADKIITKKINTLPFNIKKGEISDELFNFLKRLDKKNTFTQSLNREKALELNGLLNKDNTSVFKKIAKSNQIDTDEAIKVIKCLNKDNIGFVDEILAKYNKKWYSQAPAENNILSNLLGKINENNKKYASSLISMSEDSIKIPQNSNKPEKWYEKLQDILDFITEENEESFGIVFNSRKNGIESKFNFDELKQFTNLIQENKNPKAFEFFAGLKAENGVDYTLESEKLEKLIKSLNDELIDSYYRLFAKNQKNASMAQYINKYNESAASIILEREKKAVVSGAFLHADIESLLAIDDVNQDLYELIIKKLNNDHMFDLYHSEITEILKKTKGNPKNADIVRNYIEKTDVSYGFSYLKNLLYKLS